MSPSKSSSWQKTKRDIRKRMISGLLLLIPFFVTVVVIRWLFYLFTGLLRPLIVVVLKGVLDPAVRESIPEVYVSVAATILSLVILVALVYTMGAIAQFVVGRRLIHVGEGLMVKIPLVGTVYSATKQVVQAMSLSDKAAFKSVVLVEFPRPGFKAVAFLTGRIQDTSGRTYCKVFIPTTPNPTTGFFEMVPPEEVTETSLTIEDAFKMIISGGLIGPDTLPTGKKG